MKPRARELVPPPEITEVAERFAAWPSLLVLDSAHRSSPFSTYSFVSADPFFRVTEAAGDEADVFAPLRAVLDEWPVESIPDLPPFQGGAAGLLSYELGRVFDKMPVPAVDEFRMPPLSVGVYDWTIAWDHWQRRCWLISTGAGADRGESRETRAAERLDAVWEHLHASERALPQPERRAEANRSPTPAYALAEWPAWTSNFSQSQYLQAVAQVVEYIHAGDIFQANLSQRLERSCDDSPLALYRRLRSVNPAPFSGLLLDEEWAVISASPERFLEVRGDTVVTRPIKGTRSRLPNPEADLLTRDVLRESPKDVAENVMIVDLLRNDLSRVCRPGSVRVPQLCRVETYETVQHLVSEVRGTLRPGHDFWDVLAATFPGGSITGAPKIRAMEIIAELERLTRGAYCGSLFYCGFDGTADSSILIRTFTQKNGRLSCPVGGGIIAESDPLAEYEETLIKARGMIAAAGTS